MNRGPVLTVALGVLFALGACSDGTSSLPTAETTAGLVGGGPACNPTALKKAAEAERKMADAAPAAPTNQSIGDTPAESAGGDELAEPATPQAGEPAGEPVQTSGEQ